MRKDTTIRYICEACGTSYFDEEECKACEARHKTNARIVSMEFDPGEEYPTRIIVDFGGSKRRCAVFGEVRDADVQEKRND